MRLLYTLIAITILSITLNILFDIKKHIKSSETKIFSIALKVNLIGLIIEILCKSFIFLFGISSLVTIIFTYIYLIYQIMFISVMFIYVLHASISDVNKYKKAYKISNIVYYILSFILILLPCSIFEGYATGPAVSFTYIIAAMSMFLWFIIMIITFNKYKVKKYVPLMTLIILGFISATIQMLNPELTLITCVHFFALFIMYHTIENPDVKMINELELAKNQAEQANRAKSDFISSMSHEIRTPLNAIVGFSEFIQKEEDPKEREEDAKNILMASQTLLEIVNGILDISKIEAHKMEVIETEYELLSILNNLSELMIPRIGDKEIELKCEFASDIPKTLYGDKTKVKQIITNLLTNAVKYTEKGIINFKVNCINQKGVCTLRIVVSDTGRGIKKEQMDKLFTKFQRLEEDKNTTIEGTGLGLAITKSLIEMMGGNINVQSVYGSGSVFTVNLSQKIVNKTINNEIVETKNIIDFSDKKVVVVDDNNLNLLVASKMLKEYKIDTTLVTSGFDLLNRIEDNEHYDLVLMDDMMPKMSGKDTFKKLKENKAFNTPVVILTANAIKGMKENYIAIGFNDYLSKPIDKEELEHVLNKFLNNKEYQENNLKEEKEVNVNGKSVLIVDDNNLNIKVASNILKDYNFVIDSCLSGKECIDKIKSGSKYNLIFMDDMMPEMSGVETLNNLKKIDNFNIPVIALTANKEEGNTREYYLSLGFDEYIGKPIDKKILNEVINKLLQNSIKKIKIIKEEPNKKQASSNEVLSITDKDIEELNKKLEESDKNMESNCNTKGNIDYLKENGIDIDSSLELLGDIDMYNETLNMFIEESKARIPRLEKNKNEGNMGDYAIDVHAMKSDSKYLGFTTLSQLSYDHEMKSKENDSTYINEHYNELMEEYSRIDNILKKYI